MKYRCTVCGHIYDEDFEQILFRDLPNDWVCPICGAPKDLFEPYDDEVIREVKKSEVKPQINDDIELTPRELAIIMSNLARGAEKQYQDDLKLLFTELKDYFNDIKAPVDEAKIETLELALMKDLNEKYPLLNETSKDEGDRGTLRALTWSTKVSTMLTSLLNTYKKEGNKMLENKKIFVCSVCGFVYIGEKAPDLCPVCKVPSFKFVEVK